MEVKKFFKESALIIVLLLLTITMCSATTTSSKDQRIKSYDELKQIYMNIVGGYEEIVEYEDIVEDIALPLEMSQSVDTTSANIGSDSGAVSSTNVQVEGVEEGDIVKTDGNYIYTVSSSSDTSKVNIISTLRKGKMQVVGSISVTGQYKELYLKGNKLILIMERAMYLDLKTNKYIEESEYQKLRSEYGRCVYKPVVGVFVYDVSNPAKPKNVRNVKQDGSYLSSRLIGDQIYIVTNSNSHWIRYKTVKDININAIVPQYSDSAFGIKNKILLPQNICMFPNLSYYSFTVVSGFNINTNTKVTCEASLGGGSDIYASLNNLYVMSTNYNSDGTNIMKYSLTGGVPQMKAFGQTPGRILNQFSVDEYNGNFRVATTKGNNWSGGESSNNVYILNSSLSVIGKIENLAPGEQIYSVRFMGEKGYVVTFKEIDPLFALDLSNPKAPKVTGQLKIPGFSSYMHPYSENLLIGIGNDTMEVSSGIVTNGLKLSLFDVTNPFAPKEVHSLILGKRGTSSEVLNNHKALMFYKEKNLIGFPVNLYEGSDSSGYGTLTDIGFYLFKVDPAKGFSSFGSVNHLDEGESLSDYWSWNYDGSIKRGVYVDNVLYTISDKLVKANSLSDLKLIQQVKLK